MRKVGVKVEILENKRGGNFKGLTLQMRENKTHKLIDTQDFLGNFVWGDGRSVGRGITGKEGRET